MRDRGLAGALIALWVAFTFAACARGVPPSGNEGGSGGSGGAGGGGGGGAADCGPLNEVYGDCHRLVCQAGEVIETVDDTDVPGDSNDCTADACSSGMPVHATIAAGAPCATAGGKVCDEAGQCVGCLDALDCGPEQGCSAVHTCVPASCVDGQKDGDETDVDCGGGCGTTCEIGQTCAGSKDCAEGTCEAGVCEGCSQNVDCASGFCVDGVCCDGPCDGSCEACERTLKGKGWNGTCEAIADGADPEDECSGALVCAQSACKLPKGAPCVSPLPCASGFCTDGVCCNTACSGECEACTAAKKGAGADGVCGEIAIDTDPDSECPGDVACGGGACALFATGLPCGADGECATGHCADGVCCESLCQGSCEACTGAKKGGGVDGVCDFIAIGTDPDDECPGAAECGGGAACALLGFGTACTQNAECSGFHCVDGVCCESGCSGACQACSAALKVAGPDGFCGQAVAGTNPHGTCPGATVCAANGSCALLALGTPCALDGECGTGQCADGVCCSSACAADCWACTDAKTGQPDGMCDLVKPNTDPDDDCPGSEVCFGPSWSVHCGPALGSPCLLPGDCGSGACADGVCCDSSCGNECFACSAAKKGHGADGTCDYINAGLDPDNECFGAQACKLGGGCARLANGAACVDGAECTSGFCADGVCCQSVCNVSCAACTQAKTGAADGFCASITSGTDPDNECPGVQVCAQGTCKLPNGQACIGGVQCASGYCVDGVCCNSTCTGPCAACTAAKKGSGPDGTCGNIGAGLDPDSECFGSVACNGIGYCAMVQLGGACAANGECDSGRCADGVCCNDFCTGPCEACTAAKKASGPDGICGSVPAGTDPDDQCPGAEVCMPVQFGSVCKLPLGEPCVVGTQCGSGICSDGYCCDGYCFGTCEACSAAKKGSGANGVCGNIGVGLDPDSECFGSVTCSGGGTCAFVALGGACSADGECLSQHCADGVCCDAACSGACQSCLAAKKGFGANGTCGNIPSGQDPDNECTGALTCSGGSFCNTLPQGSACVLNADCNTGFCVDGYCCNTACNALCQACSAAKKNSGTNGICGNIGAGTDPDGECAGASTCSGAGTCGP